MARDPRPYFKMYPSDWLTSESVMSMTNAQRGAYLHLLCIMWTQADCGLEANASHLLQLCQWFATAEEFNVVYAQFVPHPENPGKVTNPRLYEEFSKCLSLCKKRVKAGRLGGEANASRLLKQNRSKREAKHTYSDSDSESSLLSSLNSSSPEVVKKELQEKKVRAPKLTDEQKIERLKTDLTYAHVDIAIEAGKCQRWCEANRKKFSYARFVNWVNRIERPLQLTQPSGATQRYHPTTKDGKPLTCTAAVKRGNSGFFQNCGQPVAAQPVENPFVQACQEHLQGAMSKLNPKISNEAGGRLGDLLTVKG